MKALLAALLAWTITLSATPAAARDWNRAVAATPAGGYLIGNPSAPVKVVEYFSLTCSHCRHFAETGIAPLRANYIATGKVSLELRNFVLNGPDLSASILMRCGTPAQAVQFFHAAYTEQDKVFAGASTLSPEAISRIEAAPTDEKAAIFAHEAAIDTWFAAHGLPVKQAAKCLADSKRQEQIVQLRKEAIEKQDVEGTPTFIVNGTKVDGTQWDDLEPAIKKALGG
jgi:protein-disulfide isomerase